MNLTDIDNYLRASGMPESRFGRAAANDSRLVSDLRKGRVLRDQQAKRVMDYITYDAPAKYRRGSC